MSATEVQTLIDLFARELEEAVRAKNAMNKLRDTPGLCLLTGNFSDHLQQYSWKYWTHTKNNKHLIPKYYDSPEEAILNHED